MIHNGGWAREARRMVLILEVQDLHVSYSSFGGASYTALAGVSFQLMPNEILGVIGESGSGKSTLAVSLHPAIRAGEQVFQVLAAHESAGKSALRQKARQVLASLFPKEADRISNSYPHQLSGGQRQRVLIAQAIACGPSLLIADEPTASLDSTTQKEILGVLRTLRDELGLAMIFITHNPALLAGFADRVLVLYGGRVAELGPARTVLSSPKHPYTRALFQSMPQILENTGYMRKTKLPVIAGDSSTAQLPLEGCVFEPRCPDRMEDCRKREPAVVNLGESHTVSCFKYGG